MGTCSSSSASSFADKFATVRELDEGEQYFEFHELARVKANCASPDAKRM